MALFGGSNPLSLIGKSVTQFQQGVSNFLRSIENFNETMEQMNGVALRINRMLDDIEPVMKVALPQLTRTLKAADDMVEQLSGPVDRVAPGADAAVRDAVVAGADDASRRTSVRSSRSSTTSPGGCSHSDSWPRPPAACSA